MWAYNNYALGYMGGEMNFYAGLFSFLFLILVMIGVVMFIRWMMGDLGSCGPVHKKPIDILKERYAKSEISKEEFEDKKKDLM